MQVKFEYPPGSTTFCNVMVNNSYLGTLEVKEDGYWDWWPVISYGGYIPAWVLHSIANKLDEINAPWDAIVQAQ